MVPLVQRTLAPLNAAGPLLQQRQDVEQRHREPMRRLMWPALLLLAPAEPPPLTSSLVERFHRERRFEQHTLQDRTDRRSIRGPDPFRLLDPDRVPLDPAETEGSHDRLRDPIQEDSAGTGAAGSVEIEAEALHGPLLGLRPDRVGAAVETDANTAVSRNVL